MLLLSELVDGQEADMFLLMTAKELLKTRDGKPYYKVSFRDAGREVSFPIWEDSPLTPLCRNEWEPGKFYKVRARYTETNYGPQLDIHKIREVTKQDERDGFDPQMCMPQSRFDPGEMFDELLSIINERIADRPLRQLVLDILTDNREQFMVFPAASRNHHAYAAGLLEHVLSVTRTCVYLADKYEDYYPDLQPPLSKNVLIAGAVLHDIGKLREYDLKPHGAEYSVEGHLVGHVLQGRDILREAAADSDVDADTLIRLEHIIVSHQRLPEWGAPKPPMTPEALLVHYADDIDAKFQMMYAVLRDDEGDGPFTSDRNPMRLKVYRGKPADLTP
jgi:3'-5' exoribonuclease